MDGISDRGVSLCPPTDRLPAPLRHPATLGLAGLPVRTWATLAIVAANIIWAGSFVATKTLLIAIPPLTIAGMRSAIAALVLTAVLALRHERAATGVVPAMLGLTSVGVYYGLQNLGLRTADATSAAIIAASSPVLVTGFAAFMLGERLRRARVAALVLSLAGVVLIALSSTEDGFGTLGMGQVLLIASASSFALSAVIGRRVFRTGNALAIVAGSTRYGLVLLLPAVAWEMSKGATRAVTPRDALLMLYLGVGCSALALLLSGFGLAHIAAPQSAMYANLQPLAGAALAVAVLNESLRLNHVIGGTVILLGVAIASREWRAAPLRSDHLG